MKYYKIVYKFLLTFFKTNQHESRGIVISIIGILIYLFFITILSFFNYYYPSNQILVFLTSINSIILIMLVLGNFIFAINYSKELKSFRSLCKKERIIAISIILFVILFFMLNIYLV